MPADYSTSQPATLSPTLPFGYVLDVIDDAASYLAIEVSASIDEDQILDVGHLVGPIRRCNEILSMHGRELSEAAQALVEAYDMALSRRS